MINTRMICALLLIGFLPWSATPARAVDPTEPLAAPLKIELQAHPGEWARGVVIVRFRNMSDEPMTIMRPLDGATWGWYMPVYRFHVVDDAGTILQLGGRCGVAGVWHQTEWPEDYVMRIPPASTALIAMSIPYENEWDRDYAVHLEYIADPARALEHLRDPHPPLPADAWVGAARSERFILRWDRESAIDSSKLGLLHAPHRLRSYRPPATPEAIQDAQVQGLAALGELFRIPIAGRDQAALERAQMLMLFWNGRGYRLDSIPKVLGEPSRIEPGAHEYLFKNGVGWRFIAEDGIVTEVRQIWPK